MQLWMSWGLLVLLVGGFLADAQQIVILSDNMTMPTGGTALLLCVGYGANNTEVSIIWSRMGQTIRNSSLATITEESVLRGRTFLLSYLQLCELQYEDSGEYTCSVTNGTQSSIGSLMVTVKGFAQVVVISNDTLGQTGGSVLLVCTGYSKPHNSSTIMWLKDNQELTNSATVNITLEDTEQGGRLLRSSYLWLSELQHSSSGNYTCTVGSEDQLASSTVNLYVPDDVIEIVVMSDRTMGTVGTSALLTCATYGRPEATVSIDWIRGGTTVQNSSDMTITFEDNLQNGRNFKQSFLRFCNLTYGDSANYTCSASNGNGIFFDTSEVELFIQYDILQAETQTVAIRASTPQMASQDNTVLGNTQENIAHVDTETTMLVTTHKESGHNISFIGSLVGAISAVIAVIGSLSMLIIICRTKNGCEKPIQHQDSMYKESVVPSASSKSTEAGMSSEKTNDPSDIEMSGNEAYSNVYALDENMYYT